MPRDTSRRTFLGAFGGGTAALLPTVGKTTASSTLQNGKRTRTAQPTLPTSGLPLELFQAFPNTLTRYRDHFDGTLPPNRVRKYNVQSYLGTIIYLQYSGPNVSWPAFSVTEFATVQEAKRVHKKEYIARAEEPPKQIGKRGTWVFRRMRGRDGLRTSKLAATQQTENIIVEGVIDMEQYQNPYDSLTSQIKHADGRDKYGEDGFPPFIIKLADHYRKNVSYSRMPIKPAKHAALQTPFGDFGRVAAQKIAEDRLGVLVNSVSEDPFGDIPQDVGRRYEVNLKTGKRRWYEPLASADWLSKENPQWEGSSSAIVCAFASPSDLKSFVADNFTRWWGFQRFTNNKLGFLLSTSGKGEQTLMGLSGSSVILDRPGNVILEGVLYRTIISGNVLLSFPLHTMPRPV